MIMIRSAANCALGVLTRASKKKAIAGPVKNIMTGKDLFSEEKAGLGEGGRV